MTHRELMTVCIWIVWGIVVVTVILYLIWTVMRGGRR